MHLVKVATGQARLSFEIQSLDRTARLDLPDKDLNITLGKDRSHIHQFQTEPGVGFICAKACQGFIVGKPEKRKFQLLAQNFFKEMVEQSLGKPINLNLVCESHL